MFGSAQLWIGVLMALAFGQNLNDRQYVDPRNRFQFIYPASFGATSPGTNDGFGDRVAAIRFSTFSSADIGGEAALTRGFPLVDLQAVGGLYDAITLEIFPDSIRDRILRTLRPLDATNICSEIGREVHLDPGAATLRPLTTQQATTIPTVDRMRNVTPRILRCLVEGTVVTFDKDVAFQAGGPRQHVYGAIRFLDGDYSTFQIVRAGRAPESQVLDQMTALVKSWTPR